MFISLSLSLSLSLHGKVCLQEQLLLTRIISILTSNKYCYLYLLVHQIVSVRSHQNTRTKRFTLPHNTFFPRFSNSSTMHRSLSSGLKVIIGRDLADKLTRSCSTHSFSRRLEGKVALITGGSTGLGKTTAQEFVQHGAQVVIADIDAKQGPQVAKDLGPSAHFVRCDVAVESDVEEAVNLTVARHGKLDIMYNNAGITGPSIPPSIIDLDLNEFDKVMKINVRGTIAGIKHAARVMVPMGCGSILCTSSISGLLGGLGPHPYSISKFAISGIVKSLASELCRSGVRINCISPSPIPTPMVISQMGLIYPSMTQEQLIKTVEKVGVLKGANCEEIDVAKAALYLASDDAKYITGHNLVVDGGFTSYKHLAFPSPDQLM